MSDSPARPGSAPVLSVRDLRVAFPAEGKSLRPVVRGASFDLFAGETLALIGQSGSGKTLTALAILGLLPPPGRVVGGDVRYRGQSLLELDEERLRRLRGSRIAIVFQDAAAALNPVVPIGEQIAEVLRAHGRLGRRDAWRRAIELLESVAVPSPEVRARAYPHQLSTGLKQRVLLAMALACEPEALIADEPTTALDVTLQAQIIELLKDAQRRRRMSILFITHDRGVVAEIAEKVAVMHAGQVVEEGPVTEVFDKPRHPHTRFLLASRPATGCEAARAPSPLSPALLEVRDLTKHYPIGRDFLGRPRAILRAVDGVSFCIGPGETLGLVGESGCGKTTLARMIPRLVEPSSGDILFEGRSIFAGSAGNLHSLRRQVQLVFQESSRALNPRKTVESCIAEGVLGSLDRTRRRKLVEEMLRRVGLEPRAYLWRFPHELSGGERQRVGIARALAVSPKLVICDEVVSSLDPPNAAEILRLLAELQAERGHSYLFISHDLETVRYLSGRVAVMYLGRIVEMGPVASVYESPHHPYTRALLESRPVEHPSLRRRREIVGEVPSIVELPSGCRFHPRCPRAMDVCRAEEPPISVVAPDHVSRCFLPR